MFNVGLTGNIASGKSTVADYFSKLGVSVINADVISKKLTSQKKPAFHEIIQHFGSSVLTDSGELNRRHLRQLIFQHPEDRLWLEALLHPLIRNDIENEISLAKGPYCLIEIPLLSNKADHPYLNRVLLVKANPEQQITRFMVRDKSTREEALAILATQANERQQMAIADDVLVNDGSLNDLLEKVSALNARYLQFSL